MPVWRQNPTKSYDAQLQITLHRFKPVDREELQRIVCCIGIEKIAAFYERDFGAPPCEDNASQIKINVDWEGSIDELKAKVESACNTNDIPISVATLQASQRTDREWELGEEIEREYLRQEYDL